MNTYVSPDLTHFVGRGRDPEAQYQLLRKILRGGWLTHPPHHPGPTSGNHATRRGGLISTNDLYIEEIICFCDIPKDKCRIHMHKYGEFGISFSKEFLIARGASPVFYVANSSMVPGVTGGQVTRADYFDEKVSVLHFLADESMRPDLNATQLSDGRYLTNISMHLHHFIEIHILGFVECFDPSLPEDHKDNYYMEREWRVFGNLKFGLADVARLTVPRAYQTKLKDDLPDYSNEVFVAEDAT